MEAPWVEEVAASLVREFLSRKGLKKTSTMMDEEFPRTALSINNRNELRNVLHLQSLYKQNKAKEAPLKTILEIMANYFLELQSNQTCLGNSSFLENKACHTRSTESFPPKNFLSGEATRGQTAAEKTKKGTPSYELSERIICLSRRHGHKPGEKGKTRTMLDAQAEGEKELCDLLDVIQIPGELSSETRMTSREKPQGQPNLLPSQGKMAASTDTSQENSLKRRHLNLKFSGICSPAEFGQESTFKSATVLPGHSFEKTTISRPLDEFLPSRSADRPLDLRQNSSPSSPSSRCAKKDDPTVRNSAVSPGDDPLTKTALERPAEEKKIASGYEKKRPSDLFQKEAPTGNRSDLQSSRKNEASFTDIRSPTAASRKDPLPRDILELVDVEDEESWEDVGDGPEPLTLYTYQVTTKPIDFNLAKDLKTLLFGSSLGCFNEEWKMQSFTFNENPELKYGIVQNKGGPCGVLAAVQAHVLQHLIFGDSSRNSTVGCLRPSDPERIQCLILALAGVLWRAGGNERVVLTLTTGTQQFTPAGKYKPDGILEMLLLHFITTYEDLLMFLQQNIHQFESGPHGCILLTLSVILSRSIDGVRGDVDVTASTLIGAHGYCTQELVNLLLTGKAVSNVFNDVMELDSGNGNITVLKGIDGRSDLGLLSLFEHYDVCQVGCYLKTPRFPIWVVCSESHFSVLFCLRKDLLGDWRTERRFDLYYYDGLANQQEEIRLTIDTSQLYVENPENDLVSPLEHCIRTKWKGARVIWNGTDPIL
ncbi:probable ubiquitin carboxyl-terminal hydrolase MINDY-4 isoform X2 [Ahaetulla prasina]|uniref:probable ubiquitin carboxyl-terminal hydrolase MINDY-4 isoform X2 n=1 Tax=Ahaetulla prasina TaxID=499056 RepID=UPI002649345D|nr:probable ubiquitin carboxyl-terminal hydrolase MINDY-4 isoform X2 [Ahaetulla prasina]